MSLLIKKVHKSYVAEAIGPIACSKDGVYLVGGASSGHVYIWKEKRTPEAVEMIIGINTQDQGQVFDMMDVGADED
ncbi:hypothetical protein E2562_038890 [Oryza meyeriana var. granulata]|uniref:Uncharacterized protein n=1 Tax=Oryza meyeriana var. granulata TaxID=110450 RepID=A0A6G1EUA1_9ORYZ|nr:hypothetical protein E2562_038890 [Oryza meyeriana var. granulata]